MTVNGRAVAHDDAGRATAKSVYRFARIPEWILLHPDLDAVDVRVFGVLDRFDGRDCIPSLKRIGERIGKSSDSVRRSLKRLEAIHAIVVEARFTEGRQTSNRYYLAGDAPLPPHPGTAATPAPGSDATPAPGTDATQSRATGTRATGTTLAHPSGEPDRFDEFWELYPRKVSKKKARQRWDAAMKARVDPQLIIDGLAARVAWWDRAGTADTFKPHPDAWLNQARWDDDLEPVPHQTRASLAVAAADVDARSADEMQQALRDGNPEMAWRIIRDKAAAKGEHWFVDVDDMLQGGRAADTIVMLVTKPDGQAVTGDDVAQVAAMRHQILSAAPVAAVSAGSGA
jgi:hypothetical protein